MNKEKNFISAVVYIHNCESYVQSFIKNLLRLLEDNFEHSEIICVNDDSTDNSVQKIKQISNKASSVALSVVNMSYFHGIETAMTAGVDLAIGDFVLEFDNCAQDYDMNQVLVVYHRSLEGFDIVSAVPEHKPKASSAMFYWLYARFTDDHTQMRTETFRILSRRALNRVSGMSKVIPYRKSLYANCGLKTANINYSVAEKNNVHESKKTRKYRQNLAVNTLIIFTNAGYFCAKAMTGLMMLISLFMAIYSLVIYLRATPVEGWTTTILFLSIAFCGLFAILTVIVKYLQILLNLSFRRKKYSFESIEKVTK